MPAMTGSPGCGHAGQDRAVGQGGAGAGMDGGGDAQSSSRRRPRRGRAAARRGRGRWRRPSGRVRWRPCAIMSPPTEKSALEHHVGVARGLSDQRQFLRVLHDSVRRGRGPRGRDASTSSCTPARSRASRSSTPSRRRAGLPHHPEDGRHKARILGVGRDLHPRHRLGVLEFQMRHHEHRLARTGSHRPIGRSLTEKCQPVA